MMFWYSVTCCSTVPTLRTAWVLISLALQRTMGLRHVGQAPASVRE